MDSAGHNQAGDHQTGPSGAKPAGDHGQVLRRILAQRDARRGGAMPIARPEPHFQLKRAVATALARAAERQAKLPVYVDKVDLAPMSLSELTELLPERALLSVIQGRRDALGMVAVCPALLASMIEMQAIGRVTSREVAARKPTRTDASISADFVNTLLAELAREFKEQPDAPDFASYHYATYLDDPRTLSLMLEDSDMTRLSLRFRIGPNGQRDGHLLMALPGTQKSQTIPPSALAPGLPVATPKAAMTDSAAQISLAASVSEAPVPLVGILCRRRISLSQLRNLTAGSLIHLPHSALDEARVETPSGQLIAQGRLGESDGFHAIRLRNMAIAKPVAATADHLGQHPPPADLHHDDPFRPYDQSANAPLRAHG